VALILAACVANGDGSSTNGETGNLIQLRDQCYAGDLIDCDNLQVAAVPGSRIHTYGATCGGRASKPLLSGCVQAFGPGETGAPIEDFALPLEELADACEAGDLEACDGLRSAPEGSAYGIYGATCGGRTESVENCASEMPTPIPEPSPAIALDQGDIDELNDRAYACLGTDWGACDALSAVPPEAYPDHRAYGLSCGGRRAESQESCATSELATLPPAADARDIEDDTDERLQQLHDLCGQGRFRSCLLLANEAPSGSDVAEYGRTCGGFAEDRLPDRCARLFGLDTVTEPSTTTPPPTTTRPPPGTTTPPPPPKDGDEFAVPPSQQDRSGDATVIVIEREVAVPPSTHPAQVDPIPYLALLGSVDRALDEAARAGVLTVESTPDAKIDRESQLRVTLARGLRVRVPEEIRRLATSDGALAITVAVSLLGDEFSGRHKVSLIVEVSRQRLRSGTIGVFGVRPSDDGSRPVTLVIEEMTVNRQLVGSSFDVPLDSLDVAGDPVKWFGEFWVIFGAAIVALGGGLLKWRATLRARQRGEGSALGSGDDG
jgi:hypothetical protein